MTTQEIRSAYLKFFADRGHAVVPRANLVPKEDPTTLFTGSGMQPLLPYLLGEEHPAGTRLVDSQTCIRVQDIKEVGDNRHTTFFEMLGNWSLGDYTKVEQIPWFWEFLTKEINLDPSRIFVTCFIGDTSFDVPRDEQSAEIWQRLFTEAEVKVKQVDIGTEENGYKVGEQDGRIFFYGDKNWWSRAGAARNMPVGEPGGPTTEMFYVFPEVAHNPEYGEHCHPNCDCGRYIELGNSVFMSYVKTEDGVATLPKQNVDYGGGLERIAAAALDSPDVFKISLLWPIVERLEKLSGKKYDDHTTAMRVIADHLRGATFLGVDGVVPSNKEQGYVMRRLVRRAMVKAYELGIEQNFLEEVVPVIADLYVEDYPEVKASREKVIEILVKEEKAFRQTLRKGIQELTKYASDGNAKTLRKNDEGQFVFTGDIIFTLYDTYGYPVELATELIGSQLTLSTLSGDWRKEFDAKMAEQRARSQTAAKGTFKGGLGGQTLQHKKYHTATHLMYQALRETLGDHVVQHGSNITEERLRFDFSHPEKVTPDQIKQVEQIVNEQIDQDLAVSWAEYPTKEATGPLGALGQFGDRYGDTVKVYKMIAEGADKPFSFEICGGPHVEHTGVLAEDGKKFKIKKEESSSAGIRRIKAVLE
jgi:alanyl-tRNA synthetase